MSGCRWWLLGSWQGLATRVGRRSRRGKPQRRGSRHRGFGAASRVSGEAKRVLLVRDRREISLRGLRFVVADAAGDEGVGEHGGAPETADEDRDAEGDDGETGTAGFAGVEDLVDGG